MRSVDRKLAQVFRLALALVLEDQKRGYECHGVCLALEEVARRTPELRLACQLARNHVVWLIEGHFVVAGWLEEEHNKFYKEMVKQAFRENGCMGWDMFLTQYRIEWLKRIIAYFEEGGRPWASKND